MSSLIAEPLLSNLEPLPVVIPKGSKGFEVAWEVLVFFERNEKLVVKAILNSEVAYTGRTQDF